MAYLSRGSDISSASLAARASSTTMPCIASRRSGPANLAHALFESERYIAEHTSSAARIPRDATVDLQVNGNQAFNRWSRRIGEMQAKKMGGPIVEVRIGRLGPVRSRIQALEINQAARLADKQLADPRRTSPLPFLRARSISRNGVT